MSRLFAQIRQLVAAGRYLIGEHASERLLERRIMEWHVVAGTADAQLIAERLDAAPNPAVEMRLQLPDGTDVKVV